MLPFCPAAPKDFMYQSGRGTGRGSATDQQVRVLLRFAGHLREDVLEQAFQALDHRDPILGCRFVETGALEGRWEWRDDLATLRLCPVVESADAEATALELLADLEVPVAGPHYFARLVRSAEGDALCLRVDHRLADGAGAKTIAYHLAELYRTLRAGRAPPQRVRGWFARTIAGLSDRRPPPRGAPPGPPAHPFPYLLPRRGFRNEDPVLAQRELAPDTLSRLRARGRSWGATVTDVLTAALVRALQPFSQVAPGEPFVIDVSADHRPRLAPEARDAICNLFAATFPVLTHSPGEPFEATLERAVKALSEIRAGFTLDAALREELAFEERLRGWARELGWPIPGAFRDRTFVILSNLGVLDEQRLDFGDAPVQDARILGTVALGQQFLVAVSTFRGRLTLSHGFCRSDTHPAVVDGILDGVMSELQGFAR
jgi:NRPS condensation-like uncharacterized protein